MATPWQRVLDWVKRTPNRTFVLLPLCVLAFELARHGGAVALQPWGAIFVIWGYLQYRLTGLYRLRRGGGGPGIETPPNELVTDGPYRYVRNPMYLGHLIFMFGVAVTLSSWLGAALLIGHAIWFQKRVLGDEARLESRFGVSYLAYKARVKRWIPGLL